jgi:hypothetical protein
MFVGENMRSAAKPTCKTESVGAGPNFLVVLVSELKYMQTFQLIADKNRQKFCILT